MKVNCIECNTPISVNLSQINDTYIPPDLCSCHQCNQKKESGPEKEEQEPYFDSPKISYKELREKEQEEISRHRWFISEKKGYDVGKDYSEIDWRKKHEQEFLKQWNYR